MSLSKKINNSNGTAFQKLVWHEMTKIPRGKTITYKELAENIGRPKAYRAVANACGANPYPIEVPCHRVVGSNGSIGGFSMKGGIKKKIELLNQENNYEFR
ncbi:MAG: methylated-DNA--[protein]-cysteine S-methyltransferase [Gammaproteobacteria bacterium]|jgi:methylated-DNA-[protein]-cysteine S-methyltransferase